MLNDLFFRFDNMLNDVIGFENMLDDVFRFFPEPKLARKTI